MLGDASLDGDIATESLNQLIQALQGQSVACKVLHTVSAAGIRRALDKYFFFVLQKFKNICSAIGCDLIIDIPKTVQTVGNQLGLRDSLEHFVIVALIVQSLGQSVVVEMRLDIVVVDLIGNVFLMKFAVFLCVEVVLEHRYGFVLPPEGLCLLFHFFGQYIFSCGVFLQLYHKPFHMCAPNGTEYGFIGVSENSK